MTWECVAEPSAPASSGLITDASQRLPPVLNQHTGRCFNSRVAAAITMLTCALSVMPAVARPQVWHGARCCPSQRGLHAEPWLWDGADAAPPPGTGTPIPAEAGHPALPRDPHSAASRLRWDPSLSARGARKRARQIHECLSLCLLGFIPILAISFLGFFSP